MRYEEVNGDIFEYQEKGYNICQWLTSDLLFNSSEYDEINDKYDIYNYLKKKYPHGALHKVQNKYIFIPQVFFEKEIFFPIIKNRMWDKTGYHILRLMFLIICYEIEQLWEQGYYTNKDNIPKIVIPQLDTKSEGLEWEKISEIIKEVFQEKDIDIVVCKKGQ